MPNINSIGANASTTIQVATTTTEVAVSKPKTVAEMVAEYFKDTPIMTKIAWCESRDRQYEKDGVTVYTGRIDNDDTGVMQINKRYHLETATKMGIDINTVEGNMAYARYLYNKLGTQPWASSQHCWDSDSQVAMK